MGLRFLLQFVAGMTLLFCAFFIVIDLAFGFLGAEKDSLPYILFRLGGQIVVALLLITRMVTIHTSPTPKSETVIPPL